MAGIGDEIINQLTRVCAAQFIDSARGTYLRRLVFDRYNGLTAKTASAAVGSASFSTSTATTTQFTIPKGTKLQTGDGRQFITTVDATFPANSTGPVLVAIVSTQAGLAQQAREGTITNIVSTITGAPGTLAVTNPLATSGAGDAEEDDDLRASAKSYFSNVQRGTLSAIREQALRVSGVKRASTFEALDERGRPALRVKLVVADAFTDALVVGTTPPAYATQSQVFAETVYAALEEYRAAGVNVDVIVGQVILQSIQLALSFDAGVDVDTVALEARAAAVTYVNNLSPGEAIVPDDLVEALRLVAGLIVTGAEVVSPSGPVIPEQLQVLRTTLKLVSTISTNPNRALQSSLNPDTVV
jgi:hypothetical protein